MVFRQGQLKGQVYNIEHPTSCFYNLTKPLTRQDLLPYQVYVPWSWEAKPTRIAAADGVEQPRSCKEAKDFDEIPTFSAVYDHSCNPDSTFLLVAMYKSICVCGCQWGVYASTWPIKKKKLSLLTHFGTQTCHWSEKLSYKSNIKQIPNVHEQKSFPFTMLHCQSLFKTAKFVFGNYRQVMSLLLSLLTEPLQPDSRRRAFWENPRETLQKENRSTTISRQQFSTISAIF